MTSRKRDSVAKRLSVGRGVARTNLRDEHKIYIVRRLATNDSLTVIARGLKQEFGIAVPLQIIQNYHPERSSGRNLQRRWRDLFARTREAFEQGTADVAGKHPLIRIHWRGEMAQETWAAGQHGVANDLLDSIAKEGDSAPAEGNKDGHFGLSGSPLTATVTIVHREEREPAPEPTRKRKPDDD
jgi:hypothetical protein